MLKSLKRIVYYSDDIEKAKDWYNKALNSQPLFDSPFAVIYTVGTCSLSIAKKEKESDEPYEKPEVYWEVDDIDSTIKTFVENGAQVYAPIRQVLNIRIAKLIDPFGNIIGLSGDMPRQSERTVEKEASSTAMSVAFCRALVSKETRDELKGPDYLAEIFLTDESKKFLKDETSRTWAIQNLVTSPLYGYFIARTAYIDSVFLAACNENIPQIVFLGAGYDTRAYRFIDNIKETKIFELDIATTQGKKINSLKENKIPIPPTLSYASINFKNEKIEDALQNIGYDTKKKTLFIWEGVSYYLAKESVESTLQFLQKHSYVGSILCFDYMIHKVESINAAEPFLFWASKNEMQELLSKYGFSITEHLDSSEMQSRYLTLNNGTVAEKCLPFMNFINAINKK